MIAWKDTSGAGKHINYRGTDIWSFHCEPWFNAKELRAKDVLGAQAEAIAMVRAKIDRLYRAINSDLGEIA
jgi:hypothetical protein